MKFQNCAKSGVAAAMILLTGCASIVSSSHRNVAFKSNPPGAEVVVSDENGKELHHGITPVTFKLRSGHAYFASDYYQVEMKLSGYQDDKGVIRPDLNGWYVGNIAFGGLIGLLIVDPMTGAMWRLPGEYNANLMANGAVSQK